MAYFSTEPASERRNLTGKNRVWFFFRLSNETHPTNRRQPAQPRRKIRPTATKTASGIPCWPSRDPIEEEGGTNLYGFGPNSCDGYDVLGGFWVNGQQLFLDIDYFTVVTDGNGGLKPYHGSKVDKLDMECCVDCMIKHEESHIEDMLKKSPNISKDLKGKNLGKDMQVLWTNLGERADTEIKAHQAEKKCLILSKAPPNSLSKECLKRVDDRIRLMESKIAEYTLMKQNYEKALKEYQENPQKPAHPPGLNPVGLNSKSISNGEYPE